jgi:hypothetical protein
MEKTAILVPTTIKPLENTRSSPAPAPVKQPPPLWFGLIRDLTPSKARRIPPHRDKVEKEGDIQI